MRELDWPRALGLIPRLAAAETMDIEGTEMGPDWRGGGGGRGGGGRRKEGGRKGSGTKKEGGREGGRERAKMEEGNEERREGEGGQ